MLGRHGPPKQPTNLRRLHGETRPSRINQWEPQPRDLPPEAPDDLSDEELTEWRRVVIELDHMGLAFAADRDIIRAYCSAVVRHAQACALIARSGLLLKGREGTVVKNPAVAMARDAGMALRAFARELGLTPAARVNFGGSGKPEEEEAAARLLS